MNITKKQLILPAMIGLFLVVPSVAFASPPGFFTEILWDLVVGFFGLILNIAGRLLNYVATHYVVGFGIEYTQPGGIGVMVDRLWETMRDIFNLTFIFGLVWLGFKMILDSANAETKRWLVHLILAALLVNFSLFITKAVVDFSNLMAYQLINETFPITSTDDYGISDVFLDNIGVHGLLGEHNIPIENATDSGYLGYVFGTAITFLIAAYVFGAGGILLLIRYVALIFYLILSPLMFLGWVFPQLQSVTTKYWRGFMGRAFFAPVYFLMIFISLRIIESVSSFNQLMGNDPQFADIYSSDGDNMDATFGTTFMPFVLACGFLMASLTISQKMGADGAGAAVGFASKVKNGTQRYVQRKAWQGTKFATSQTAGRAARRTSYALGKSLENNINRMQASNQPLVKAISRLNAVDRGVRGVAQKGQKSRYGMSQNIDQEKAQQNEIAKRAKSTGGFQKNEAAYYQASEKAARAQNPAEKKKFEQEARGAKKEMQTNASKMSNEQLLTLSKEQLKLAAGGLSDGQIKHLEDSGRFKANREGYDSYEQKNDEIKDIKDSRDVAIQAQDVAVLEDATASTEDLTKAMQNLSRISNGLSSERKAEMAFNSLKGETNEPTDVNAMRTTMNFKEKDFEAIQEKYGVEMAQKARDSQRAALTQIADGDYGEGKLIAAGTKDSNGNKITKETHGDEFKNLENAKRTQRQLIMARKPEEIPTDIYTNKNMTGVITDRHYEQKLRNDPYVNGGDIGKMQAAKIKQLEELSKTSTENYNKAEKELERLQRWTAKSNFSSEFDFSGANLQRPSITDTVAAVEEETNNQQTT